MCHKRTSINLTSLASFSWFRPSCEALSGHPVMRFVICQPCCFGHEKWPRKRSFFQFSCSLLASLVSACFSLATRLAGSPAHRLTGTHGYTGSPATWLAGCAATRLAGSLAVRLVGSPASKTYPGMLLCGLSSANHDVFGLKNCVENDHFFNFRAAQTKSHDLCHKRTSININLLASFSWFRPSRDLPQTNIY